MWTPNRWMPGEQIPSWYTAPDNAGVAAIKAKTDTINWGDVTSVLNYAISMSQWKNNKLIEVVNGDGTRTIKLRNDTDTADLLTWTYDPATLTRSKAV